MVFASVPGLGTSTARALAHRALRHKLLLQPCASWLVVALAGGVGASLWWRGALDRGGHPDILEDPVREGRRPPSLPRPEPPRTLPRALSGAGALPRRLNSPYDDYTFKLTSHPKGQLYMAWFGSWRPVCSSGFVDTNEGAVTACRSMGYRHGKVTSQPTLTQHGLYLGECLAGEPVSGACTAGQCCGPCNRGDVGCVGCLSGNAVGVEVECVGRAFRTDLKLGSYPRGELYVYTDSWKPVCRDGFVDSQHGAIAACQAMGFSYGVVYEMEAVTTQDALLVGECAPGETPPFCTASAHGCAHGSVACGPCAAGGAGRVEVHCLGDRAVYQQAVLQYVDGNEHWIGYANGTVEETSSPTVQMGDVFTHLMPFMGTLVRVEDFNPVSLVEWQSMALAGKEFVHRPWSELVIQFWFAACASCSCVTEPSVHDCVIEEDAAGRDHLHERLSALHPAQTLS